MTSIVFVEDSKLESISKFILDLCRISEIDERKLNIKGLSGSDCKHKSHILVLNAGGVSPLLQNALEAIAVGGIIIMDSDEKNYAGLKLLKPVRLISYGYNPKSTITTSSIVVHDSISIQCCIQRKFDTLAGEILEPQEFLVCTDYAELSAGDILAGISVAMLCGASIEKISHSFSTSIL